MDGSSHECPQGFEACHPLGGVRPAGAASATASPTLAQSRRPTPTQTMNEPISTAKTARGAVAEAVTQYLEGSDGPWQDRPDKSLSKQACDRGDAVGEALLRIAQAANEGPVAASELTADRIRKNVLNQASTIRKRNRYRPSSGSIFGEGEDGEGYTLEVVGRELMPEEALEYKELVGLVIDTVKNLPKGQKAVAQLILSGQAKGPTEAAELLNRPVGSVTSDWCRGRAHIKERLQPVFAA